MVEVSSNVCPDYRENVATHSVTRIGKRLNLHVERGGGGNQRCAPIPGESISLMMSLLFSSQYSGLRFAKHRLD